MVRLIGIALAFVSSLIVVHGKWHEPKEWSKFSEDDWERLERELEEGDAPEELKTEDELVAEAYERRRRALESDVPLDELKETARHQDSMAGPAMLFASVTSRTDGSFPAEEELSELGDQWRNMLLVAGIYTMVYQADESSLMFALQKGWYGAEVLDFLLERPEVEKVEWDGETYDGHSREAAKKSTKKKTPGKRKKKTKNSKPSSKSRQGRGKQKKVEL